MFTASRVIRVGPLFGVLALIGCSGWREPQVAKSSEPAAEAPSWEQLAANIRTPTNPHRLLMAFGTGRGIASIADEKKPDRIAIFADWPKPQAVIAFSGQQHGYLEPCGCSPEFQKGGLARRFAFLKSLEQKKWPTLAVDLGGLLDDHSKQPIPGKYVAGPEQLQAKLEVGLEAMQRMRYAAMNVGPEDIDVPQGFLGLVGLLLNLNDPPLPRALSANVGVPKDFVELGLITSQAIYEVGGLKVATVGAVGAKAKERMADPVLGGWEPPEKILQQELPKLTRQSDIQLLLLYAPLQEAKQIAEKFPALDLIIHASESEEPTGSAEWVGKTMLVTIGSKGKYTGAIGIFAGEPRFRFELIPLDDRFDEEKTIRELLDKTYITKLEQLDLVARADKTPYDRSHPNLAYVGSKKCAQCHENVYKFWLTTRHSHALETLVDGYEKAGKTIAPGKHVNPECVSCHTTGFFHTSGYDGTAQTQHLGGNGCENCHGPGSEHVRILSQYDLDAEQLRLAKKMMHLPLQTERRNVCVRCHDIENSPKFELETYWEHVEHGAQALDDKNAWPKIRESLRKARD